MSSCSSTNECDNLACKNDGDDNMHACCINGICTCTTNPCGSQPPSPFPSILGNNALIISIIVISISLILPVLIFSFNGKSKTSNDDDD